MRKINQKSLDCIKKSEGLRLKAYRDIGGVITIGYGHTNAAGGRKIAANTRITEEEAEAILMEDLTIYEECVEKHVKVPLTDNQFGALVSFCYNVGVDNFVKSRLLKRLNAGFYETVPPELQRWNKVKGNTSKGLINRRERESDLWGENEEDTMKVKQRDAATKSVLNVDMVSSVLGSLSGLGGVLAGNGAIQYAFAAIMVIMAIMAAIIMYKRLWSSKL